jgi:MOSC domain-containing protein YiiM
MEALFETQIRHLTRDELEAGLEHIRQSPRDNGVLELIVCRPAVDERKVLEVAELDVAKGLIGDTWPMRGSSKTADGGPHPEMQINIMNARAVALVAQNKERWRLAGDQLYIDMDLSKENLPAGARFSLGTAILEVTAPPHTGCHKFVSRFGLEAMKFVNSEIGRALCLRGINARVVQSGTIEVGQVASKVIA